MNQNGSLEAPFIALRNERKEIDLAELGGDSLEIIIKYTGMAEGHLVNFQWLGADPDGNSFDDTPAYRIEGDDLPEGKKIYVKNSDIKAIEGGEAFCSYSVTTTAQQSLRLFSFIGVRPVEPSGLLPVVLAVESHNLVIKPDELETEGVTFVVAPYQAMQVDDEITFTFNGFDDHGDPGDTIIKKLPVTAEHLANKALTFTVGKNEFLFIKGGRAEVFYKIDFGDGKIATSPQQVFAIDSNESEPDFLPEPVIVGHEPPEDPLNPDKFTKGVPIWVDAYPGMAVSDRVTLCWRSNVRDYMRTIRVDTSTQAVEGVVFHIPVDYLLENQGRSVRLHYLFGREGAGLQSKVLPLSIEYKRELPAPLIAVASADDSGKDRGTMEPSKGREGVWVEVPPDVLAPGETAQVEWRGWPGYGEYQADPEDDNPLLFYIPPQYVPANMGRSLVDESRRFNVVYRVIVGNELFESAPYHLRIQPYTTGYPRIVCDRVVSGELILKDVPLTGVDLTLGTWHYGAKGNLIELSITGRAPGNPDFVAIIRGPSEEVTESEAESGISAKLERALLEQLEVDAEFTLRVRMSFDGGAHYFAFPSQPVMLRE